MLKQRHLHQFIAIDSGTTDLVCAACEYLTLAKNADGPHPICKVNQRRRDAFAAAFVAGNIIGDVWEMADRLLAADGVG